MRVIKALEEIPQSENFITIYLAGGVYTNWRKQVEKYFSKYKEVVLINPVVDRWIEGVNVKWELNALSKSDIVVFAFFGNTLAGISLFELGFVVRFKPIVIFCEDDFWKKSYLYEITRLFDVNVTLTNDFSEFLKEIEKQVKIIKDFRENNPLLDYII